MQNKKALGRASAIYNELRCELLDEDESQGENKHRDGDNPREENKLCLDALFLAFAVKLLHHLFGLVKLL